MSTLLLGGLALGGLLLASSGPSGGSAGGGVRGAILDALEKLIALEPSDPRYVSTVYPFDDPLRARLLAAEQSGCGLVTEVGWRAAKIADKRLYLPVFGRSSKGGVLYPVALEYDDALKFGAWVPPTPEMKLPSPADAMIIGKDGDPSWGGVQHELTVTGVGKPDAKGRIPIDSIDGGQPGIHRRKRFLAKQGSEWWLYDSSGGARRVFGYTNVDRLPREV